eukprot:377358-Amphidinium_carterae.1
MASNFAVPVSVAEKVVEMLAMGPSDYNKRLISNMAKVKRQARHSASENSLTPSSWNRCLTPST